MGEFGMFDCVLAWNGRVRHVWLFPGWTNLGRHVTFIRVFRWFCDDKIYPGWIRFCVACILIWLCFRVESFCFCVHAAIFPMMTWADLILAVKRIIKDLSTESEGKHAMLDSLLLIVYQIQWTWHPWIETWLLCVFVEPRCIEMYVVVVSGMDFPDMTGK